MKTLQLFLLHLLLPFLIYSPIPAYFQSSGVPDKGNDGLRDIIGIDKDGIKV